MIYGPRLNIKVGDNELLILLESYCNYWLILDKQRPLTNIEKVNVIYYLKQVNCDGNMQM